MIWSMARGNASQFWKRRSWNYINVFFYFAIVSRRKWDGSSFEQTGIPLFTKGIFVPSLSLLEIRSLVKKKTKIWNVNDDSARQFLHFNWTSSLEPLNFHIYHSKSGCMLYRYNLKSMTRQIVFTSLMNYSKFNEHNLNY